MLRDVIDSPSRPPCGYARVPAGRAQPHRRKRALDQRGEIRHRARSERGFFRRRAPRCGCGARYRARARDLRIPKRFGLHPVHDIQVLTPMHRGDAGAVALNESLQAALNPTGRARARREHFASATKSCSFETTTTTTCGTATSAGSRRREESAMPVAIRRARKHYGASDLDDLALAYAWTIHKSQGSEYPAVVVALLTTHFVMLTQSSLHRRHARQTPRGSRLRSARARARDLPWSPRRPAGGRPTARRSAAYPARGEAGRTARCLVDVPRPHGHPVTR